MLAVAILAAGKGTRMKSAHPKVLQELAGITLIERVLKSTNGLNPVRNILIVGHQSELIKKHLEYQPQLEFVLQEPLLGTGHAIQQLLHTLKGFHGELLILNGDVPLLKETTIQQLLSTHRLNNADVTLLTTKLREPKGYGRVFVEKHGQVKAIVEDKDCNEKQLKNTLVNSGIYCFNWEKLAEVLPKLSNKNLQKEFYLTDVISMLPLAIHMELNDPSEVYGINNRLQMAQCEMLLQERLRNYWMNEGVTFKDPQSCSLSEDCLFGVDVIIEPQTHLRGTCQIGNNCTIGPGSLIEDSVLGNKSKVIYSVVSNSKIGDNVSIGPYSHLRPDTTIAGNCKIGNFVEIKKSNIGSESKVNHLSYIGDAEVGRQVNIGAGTITANYDGKTKYRSLIGDKAKTGANSVLVAPISLGTNVTVGAGSTLTKDVPDNSLALGRAKQLIKRDWVSSREIQS